MRHPSAPHSRGRGAERQPPFKKGPPIVDPHGAGEGGALDRQKTGSVLRGGLYPTGCQPPTPPDISPRGCENRRASIPQSYLQANGTTRLGAQPRRPGIPHKCRIHHPGGFKTDGLASLRLTTAIPNRGRSRVRPRKERWSRDANTEKGPMPKLKKMEKARTPHCRRG